MSWRSLGSDLTVRVLDNPITVTTRELLASAGGVRHALKDVVTSKKIAPVNNVQGTMDEVDAYLMASTGDINGNKSSVEPSSLSRYDPAFAAKHSLPLRVTSPTFSDGVERECILDSGSEILVMREDVWKVIRAPLTSNKIMCMEASNSSQTTTLGVLENCPVTIGPVTFLLLRRANITENKEKIRWAIRYGGAHAESWEAVSCLTDEEDADPDFETFKADVRRCRHHLNEETLYTLRDLEDEDIVEKTKALTTMNCQDLGAHVRPYRIRAAYLVRQKLLSVRERNFMFLSGFPDAIRNKIVAQVAICNPGVRPENGYDTKDIENAAEFVVGNGGGKLMARRTATVIGQGIQVRPG